jgi:hypothetical protein
LITSDIPKIITIIADSIVVMNRYLVMEELPNTRDYTDMSGGIMELIHEAEEAAESVVQVAS